MVVFLAVLPMLSVLKLEHKPPRHTLKNEVVGLRHSLHLPIDNDHYALHWVEPLQLHLYVQSARPVGHLVRHLMITIERVFRKW